MAGLSGAKATITSTDIAQNHKRGRTTTPTLRLIGTHTTATYCMQTAPLDDMFDIRRISRTSQADLQPFGLPQILCF